GGILYPRHQHRPDADDILGRTLYPLPVFEGLQTIEQVAHARCRKAGADLAAIDEIIAQPFGDGDCAEPARGCGCGIAGDDEIAHLGRLDLEPGAGPRAGIKTVGPLGNYPLEPEIDSVSEEALAVFDMIAELEALMASGKEICE